jgi:hypothetical protein
MEEGFLTSRTPFGMTWVLYGYDWVMSDFRRAGKLPALPRLGFLANCLLVECYGRGPKTATLLEVPT